MQIPIDTLVVEMRGVMMRDMMQRVEKALASLVDLIKEAYARPQGNSPEGVPLGFTASHGGSGAIGALGYEVKQSEKFIEGIIGVADSARYLQNLEFGEGGTNGAPSTGALFERHKMPPVEKIADWIRMAGIAPRGPQGEEINVPRHRRKGNGTSEYDKAVLGMAWAIAMKRKRVGRPAMRVIERTLNAHREQLISLLSGA